MVKPRLYLETTIPSYLTAWPSRDPYVAGQQQITKDWWQQRKDDFEIYISQFVWIEAAAGDPDAAEKRLDVLKPFPMLDANEAMERLAAEILELRVIPKKAERDAAHIAICAVHQIDYLMTWNCAYIANGEIIKVVRKICAKHGVECPEIHTPAELMGI
ncbi:MAG: type II toxin-antitoxin system VapC family toxin [Planctomycetaceae bacterium]